MPKSWCPTGTVMKPLTPRVADHEIPKLARGYKDALDRRELAAIAAGQAAKTRGQLMRDEFRAIAEWKSARNKHRYEKNTEAQVADVWARTLAVENDVERVVVLTELDGVSVRTATAILHLCYPEAYPLLDVWAMTALGVPRETTEKWNELDWLRIWPGYVTTCRAIASRTGLDLRTIDRALWSYGEAAGSKRRK